MDATQKQLEFIKTIEEYVSETFKGSTKSEASEYISRNIDEFRKKQADDIGYISRWEAAGGYF